jgi:hypothetical protein
MPVETTPAPDSRPTITTRTAKGTPLTIAEMDANLTNLREATTTFITPGTRTSKNLMGNITNSTVQKKIGSYSMNFNGSSNYYSVSNPYVSGMTQYDFRLDSSTFTIEFWVYPETRTSANGYLLDFRAYDMMTMSMDTSSLTMFLDPDNKIQVATGVTNRITSTAALAYNTWSHIVLQRNPYGSYGVEQGMTLYVNGVKTGSTWNDSMYYFSNNSSSWRQGNDTNSANYFKGYIDEVRYSRDTLRYTTFPFTPPTTAFSSDYSTKLLIHGDSSYAGGSFPVDDTAVRIATTLNDTLEFAAGSNITISGDAASKRVTISYQSSSGGLTLASSLTDVMAMGPQSGDSLVYDSSQSRWTNRNIERDYVVTKGQYFVSLSGQAVMKFDMGNKIDYNNLVSQGSAGEGTFTFNQVGTYLIEITGNVLTNFSGDWQLKDNNNNVLASAEGNHPTGGSGQMPEIRYQVSVMSAYSTSYYLKPPFNTAGTSGESFWGTPWMKITRISLSGM